MDIFLTAYLRPVTDFLATYRTGDATRVDAKGCGLLLMALQNKDLASRYAIADFLLDHGAPVETSGNNGATVLHVLFGQVSHDLARDENLARRLIERGAHINATDLDGRLPFVDVLAMKFTDDQLQPIYDLWFAQPDPDFTTASRFGLSPLTAAMKLPYRSAILARMNEHLRDHA